MKKILFTLSLAAVVTVMMTACKSRTQSAIQPIKYEDTVGLAQFQEWKAMNERMTMMAYQPVNNNVAPVRQRSVSNRSTSGSMSSSSTNYAKTTTKKKGWSKAAKYSAIGGGSGIVLGAIINKRNRVAGGAVGGMLLAGAGYLLGRSQDKKEGRY